MFRSIALFAHVTSAMCLFSALAIEGSLLLQLRRSSTTSQLQAVLGGFKAVRGFGIAGVVATVVTGGYLTAAAWNVNAAWIVVAIVAMTVSIFCGAILNPRGVKRLRAALTASSGDALSTVAEIALDKDLSTSFIVRAALITGIVYLMTVKPQLMETLIVMGLSVAAIAVTLALVARSRLQSAQMSKA